MGNQVTPYRREDRSKKEQVTEMFDNIAPQYDLLNHLLTMGIDVLWRRKAIRLLGAYRPELVLDLATGTGDFAIEALRIDPKKIIALDISPEMLRVAAKKLEKRGLSDKIELVLGDSENLPFGDESVNAITVGFGVRNFEDLQKGMREMYRVLTPGGAVAILEPSYPSRFPLKQLFHFYFKTVTPAIGKLISGDDAAYTYLPESVVAFPNGSEFVQICRESGFSQAVYKPQTFGVCSLYLLEK